MKPGDNKTFIEEVKNCFDVFFRIHNFKELQLRISDAFGDTLIIFGSDKLQLRFISDRGEVFVTAAEDISNIVNSQHLANRLTLVDDLGTLRRGPFTVIEFDTPSFGIASPVNREIPGFIGGGLTQGGAREFTLPNLKIDELQNIRRFTIP